MTLFKYLLPLPFLFNLSFAAADEGLNCLVKAYPEFLSSDTDTSSNTLLWRDGTRMTYSDGVEYENFEERLNHSDLKDQMSIPYSLAALTKAPAMNEDSGRLRDIDFFMKMYGSSSAAVQKNLVKTTWQPSGSSVMFSRVNGANEALEKVGQKIAEHPELKTYVSKSLGTFNWRMIQGTTRQSNHSFGTAIDFQLPSHLQKYWLWAGCKPNKACAYPEKVLQDSKLQKIVAIFEEFGFIWGGKWYHYDTMHFEYRPELINCSSTH